MFASVLLLLQLLLFTSVLFAANYLADPLKTLQLHMNVSVDPCENFYNYACGRWRVEHKNNSYNSVLEQLDDGYNTELAKLLEQQLPTTAHIEPRFVRLLRAYHTACIGLNDEKYDSAMFIRWLRHHDDLAWPSSASNYDWTPLFTSLWCYGLSGILLQVSVIHSDSNDSNDSQWWLEVQPPWPATYGDEETDFSPLSRDLFERLYRALNPRSRQVALHWKQVQNFETKLLRFCQEAAEEEKDDSRSDDSIPIDQLDDTWLRSLLNSLADRVSGIQGSPRLVHVQNMGYVRRLRELLADQEPQLVGRYLLLRLLHYLEISMPSRWDRVACASHVHRLLTPAAAWLPEHRRRLQAVNPLLDSMFASLKQQFNSTLASNRNQFDKATQRYLHTKLAAMRLRLGILPASFSTAQLERFYIGLKLSATNFYGNLLATLRHTTRALNKRRAQPMDIDEAPYLVETDGYGSYASPFFLPRANSILLPVGLFAAPVYRVSQHPLFTHSSLGFLLAHELSHGFAPGDVQYDEHGNRAALSLSDGLAMSDRFLRQLRCLHVHHGGVADEKFADTNGIAIAYNAYFAKESTVPLALPFGVTSVKQLFFINAAQFFCQGSDPNLDFSQHGSSRQRINDAFASFPHFSRVFNCRPRKRHICHLY